MPWCKGALCKFMQRRNTNIWYGGWYLDVISVVSSTWHRSIMYRIDYAWWHGLIDSVTKDDLHREWQHCILKGKREPAPFHPYTVPDECGMMGVVAKAAGAGLLPHGLAPNVYGT